MKAGFVWGRWNNQRTEILQLRKYQAGIGKFNYRLNRSITTVTRNIQRAAPGLMLANLFSSIFLRTIPIHRILHRRINFQLPVESNVNIWVYDLTGYTLVNSNMETGYRTSGVWRNEHSKRYLCLQDKCVRWGSLSYAATRKLVLIK